MSLLRPSVLQSGRRWLLFDRPVRTVKTVSAEQVLPLLREVEQQVEEEGLLALGFVAYEAGFGLDSSLPLQETPDFPLLWMTLYRSCECLDEPALRTFPEFRWEPSIDRNEYRAALLEIKEQIARGNTYQVNFTFKLRSGFEGDPWELFWALTRANGSRYGAFLDLGRWVVCSASPELFFELSRKRIRTRPMKGTVRRGLYPEADERSAAHLYHSAKNRAENLMIVDMMRNDLGRIAEVSSVNVPKLFELEKYPSVWQMTSTVQAETRASVTDIFGALFPSASITGAPKLSTMKICAELEKEPRGIYTGSIGYIAPGRRARFNVAIRTMVMDRRRNEVEYGTGGGIVWDSEMEEEFDECQAKAPMVSYRSFDFSLLETILWTPDESYFLLAEHFERLSKSAGYFDFQLDAGRIKELLLERAASFDREMRVRVLVSRNGQVRMESAPLPESGQDRPVRLKLALQPVRSREVFLYHKTTNRRIYDSAMRLDAEEVLLWNEAGEITETTTGNVVVSIGGRLRTPPVRCGLLAGTFRSVLLREGVIEEAVISLEDLPTCEEIFLVNAVRKWRKADYEPD